MPSTSANSQSNVGSVNLVATHSRRSVQEDFERLPGNEAPSVALFGYGKAVTLDEGFKVQRIVDKALPQTITLTAAYTAAGTSLTVSAYDAQVVQVGQLLLVEDEIMRVTGVPGGTTINVSTAFAGTTNAGHASGTVVRIMSPVYLDTDTFQRSPRTRGEFKAFYPAQIMYKADQTAMATSINSYLTKGQDDLTFDKAEIMKAAVRQLEPTIWYSKAQVPTASAPGAFDGIARLVTSNTVAAGGVLTAKLLNDLIEMIMTHKNSNNTFTIFGNRNMKRVFDAVMRAMFDKRAEPDFVGPVKVRIDRFETSLGTLEFSVIPNLRDGELYAVRREDIKLHPLDLKGKFSPGWHEVDFGVEENNALVEGWGYYNLLTLIIGDERLHGKITGITMTAGSYTGYV